MSAAVAALSWEPRPELRKLIPLRIIIPAEEPPKEELLLIEPRLRAPGEELSDRGEEEDQTGPKERKLVRVLHKPALGTSRILPILPVVFVSPD